MKRIDFLGAPGVGKSTIYNEYITNNKNVVPELKARLEAVRRFNKKYGGKGRFGTEMLLQIPKFRNPYIISLESKIQKKHLSEYMKKVDELTNLVNQAFCLSTKDNYRKQFGYIAYFNKLKVLCSLDNYFEKEFISDESFSQKVYGIQPSDELHKNITAKYFELIPKPEKLIYCYADAETVVERIISRKKTIPSHRGKTEEELLKKTKTALNIAEIGAITLRKRGVEIVELDTRKK